MLAGGLNGAYRALLAGPHKPIARLEVWRQGVRIDTFGNEGLPFLEGAINATLISQVTRQLSFSTYEEFWPADVTDLLAPYGNEIYVFQGVENGAGIPYSWQTFRGRINEVSMDSSGRVGVDCLDRAADVNDAGFALPENSRIDVPVTDEFRRLVIDAIPNATFGTFDLIGTLTPELTWEWDRGTACDDLANAGGAFWYALANGDYVMRFVPWTVDQTPLLTLTDGEGGTITDAIVTRSREDVFNLVTAVGERADGSDPTYATEQDLNPASPTYVNGGFGLKSKLVRVQAAINQSQAMYVARTALRQAKSLTEQWTINIPADPSMELGDAFSIKANGLPPVTQVVSAFNIPLAATGSMNVQLHALQPGLTIQEE